MLTLAPDKIDDFVYRYYGSLQYLDHYVGEVFRSIKDTREWDKTLVIFTADHGEEFFEHSYFSHGAALYQESVRVPLIVKWPDQAPSQTKRIARNVSALQIIATILQAAGIEPVGTTLMPPLPVTEGEADQPSFSEFDRRGMVIYSAQLGRFRQLYSEREDGKQLHELYDVREDPAETNNLRDEGTEPPAELTAQLQNFIDFISAAKAERNAAPLPQDELDKLRSLGYLQ
jgi:arylsulfatase A-like enzyme